MEDEERGCSGCQGGRAARSATAVPRSPGSPAATGGGPPRVVGVQLDLPVRRAAGAGEAEGGRLPPWTGHTLEEIIAAAERGLQRIRPPRSYRFRSCATADLPMGTTTSLEAATFVDLAHAGSL